MHRSWLRLIPALAVLLACAAGPAAAEPVVTRDSVLVAGRTLRYTATAGFLPVEDAAGAVEANIFFVSYTLADSASARRPLTFAFNGGPGASSVWLHLGGLGPRRVVLADSGTALPRRYRMVDNQYTWLGFTDLVFVDPVGTGLSRAAAGVSPERFWSVDGDVRSIGSFIRLYLTRYDRWLSPIVLAGESYGTARAAGLSTFLADSCAIFLDAAVLLSSALDFAAISFTPGNDLPYPLALPSYAAAAWYHRKLSPRLEEDLGKTLAEVEAWAANEYTPALAAGDRLSTAERQAVIDRLAEYTGLTAEVVARHNLRINVFRFAGELLADEQRTLGLLDGRVAGLHALPPNEAAWSDPSMFLVTGPYVAVLNDYLRRDLDFATDIPYIFLSMAADAAWKFGSARNGFLYVGDDLGEAMARNRTLAVFVGEGIFDLTTPFAGQDYVLAHLGLPAARRTAVERHTYESGHQIYTSVAMLEKLTADVEAFLGRHLAAAGTGAR